MARVVVARVVGWDTLAEKIVSRVRETHGDLSEHIAR